MDKLAVAINAEIEKIKQVNLDARRIRAEAVKHSANIGMHLLDAKSELDHGEFGEWLKKKLKRSERTTPTSASLRSGTCRSA